MRDHALGPPSRDPGRGHRGVQDTQEWRAGRKEDVYKTSLRLALTDKLITRTEERHLAELAAHLDLDPPTALRMREEVERELGLVAEPQRARSTRRGAKA